MATKLTKLISSPISLHEFSNALVSIWKNDRRDAVRSHTLGLAISGGVDSMALVSLCSGLLHTKPLIQDIPNLKFQAFVVDHGVRKGSNTEAEAVSKVLESRGIPASILTINWGNLKNPGEANGFESLARKFRFQALGRACRDHHIDSLFLAHHNDDLVETVIMRLIAGHRNIGLLGMKARGNIPECDGIYGVQTSGGREDPASPIAKISGPDNLSTEIGGVKIYRPLLQFSKTRLVATCQESNMEWFEDPTNKDVTLTPRNAIRHLLQTKKLPTAFTADRLNPYVAKLQAKHDALLQSVTLTKCTITDLNTRAGTLKVRFPEIGRGSQSAEERQKIAAFLLRKVMYLVSPLSSISLSSLHGSVIKLFPDLSPVTSAHALDPKEMKGFTIGNVYFQPLLSPPSATSKPTWFLSRQPFYTCGSGSNSCKFDIPPAPPLPPGPVTTASTQANPQWTPWHLFDGRFWIRILNLTQHHLVVHPLVPKESTAVSMPYHRKPKKLYTPALKKHAPGAVRLTLPAIFWVDSETGKEELMALPTLDPIFPLGKGVLRWEVRYKNIDVERLDMRVSEKRRGL